jgi:hypothetical protein
MKRRSFISFVAGLSSLPAIAKPEPQIETFRCHLKPGKPKNLEDYLREEAEHINAEIYRKLTTTNPFIQKP